MRWLQKAAIIAAMTLSLLLGSISPVHAEVERKPYKEPEIIWSLRLDKLYDIPFVDKNKTWKGDSQRCWMYSILSMIEFAIPDSKPAELQAQLEEYVKGDVGYDGFTAMQYLFEKNKLKPVVKIIRLDATTLDQRYEMNTWIMGSILKHQIVYANIVYPNPSGRSHAIVVYGYEIDSNYDLYLYYVDSDDKKRKMYRNKVKLTDDSWLYFASGKHIGWKFNLAFSLDMFHKFKAVK